MSLVAGKDFTFYVFDAGIWKPYCCARSGSVSIDTSTIETTGPGTGDYKTFEPEVHGFTASIDGVISLNISGQLTWPELQAKQLAKTKLLCRFTEISQAGDIYTKECYFYITNSTDTGSFDGVSTFQVSLQGTGGITLIFVPPTPIIQGKVYRYPAAGSTAPVTAGATVITVPGLGTKNILSVWKDGIGNNDIILAGTPVNKEVKYTTSGADGVFEWAIPFESGENWYVLYQGV